MEKYEFWIYGNLNQTLKVNLLREVCFLPVQELTLL